jgi:hypothetical protein
VIIIEDPFFYGTGECPVPAPWGLTSSRRLKERDISGRWMRLRHAQHAAQPRRRRRSRHGERVSKCVTLSEDALFEAIRTGHRGSAGDGSTWSTCSGWA